MRRSALSGVLVVAVLGIVMGGVRPARAQIVTNGAFDTGDFTGWSLNGDTAGVFVAGAFPGPYSAALTTSTAQGFLEQGLTLVVGQSYTVTFSLAGDGATPNSFSVSLGGTVLGTQTDFPLTLPSSTPFSYAYTATAASSLLSFSFRDDPGFLYLSNIAVTPIPAAVPEPSPLVSGGLLALALSALLARGRRSTRFQSRPTAAPSTSESASE